MSRRVAVPILAILAIAFGWAAWAWLTQSAVQRAADQAERAEKTALAVAESGGVDWIEVQAPDGAVWVIGRQPGESDKDFAARAARVIRGEEESGGNCRTLECPVGTVNICVTCMVGEPQEDCDARRDALASAWCAQNPGCTNCP